VVAVVEPVKFRMTVEDFANIHLVRLYGELDMACAHQVESQLTTIAGSTVVVDLGDLWFMDVRGLAALEDAFRQIVGTGHQMVVRRAHGQVRRLIDIAGATDMLEKE
jgi:anti-anti-sigma factor